MYFYSLIIKTNGQGLISHKEMNTRKMTKKEKRVDKRLQIWCGR